MDSEAKLKLLGELARFDVSGYPSLFAKRRPLRFRFIYPAVGERGRCVRLFKVLQDNECQGNCFYCSNRSGRDFPRISFGPSELAQAFMEYCRKGLVDGLFLSSAISKEPDEVQEEMLQTIEILRLRYGYRGYIHTKVLPGVSKDLILKAARFSDRLSMNLEVPKGGYLSKLSSSKKYERELLSGLGEIVKVNSERPLKAGVTTQFVVGAAGETDREILELSGRLYRDLRLSRVYYSGFIPLADTPLENLPPCPNLREFRLYQADSLLKRYGFTPEELTFDRGGALPLDQDPKLAWAVQHPERFPIEINRASYEELIRVPGIGRISAQRVVDLRREAKIRELEQLRRLGAVIGRARNFITLNGKFSPSEKAEGKRLPEEQLFLWQEL